MERMASEQPGPEQVPPHPFALVVLDEHGVVAGAGDEAAAMLAADGAVLGHDLVDLVAPPDIRPSYHAAIEPLLQGRTRTVRGLPVVRSDAGGNVSVIELDVEALDVAGRRLLLAVLHRPVPPPDAGRQLTMLEWIFRHAPESITILDEGGRQILVNPAGAAAFGYGGEESLFSAASSAMNGRLLLHPDDVEGMNRSFADRLSGTTPWETPLRFRVLAGDGTWRWAESLSMDLRHIPEVSGIVAFTRDVTEEVERSRRLFESEAQLSAVIRNLTRPAVLEGPDGVVRYHNDLFGALMAGRADEDHAGTPLLELLERLRPSAGPAGEPFRDVAWAAGPTGSARSEPVALHGRVYEIDTTNVWSGDELLGRFWVFTDVTDRVEEERRLRSSLDRELAARHLAEERVEQLSEIDRLRTRLVSTVSHELRTPLTTISAAVEHLRTGEADADELDRYLAMIERNALRLNDLVEDLLVLGRVESGLLELRFAPVDPAGIARDVVTEEAPAAATQGIRLVLYTEDGPRIEADAARLRQVLQNLVSNAVKFGPRGSVVEVRAEPAGAGWRLEVRDTGPGIAPEERNNVFQPFYRARSAEAVAGSGLGLAIALGIVHAHSGTLDIVDVPGWGCVLRCELPVAGARRRA
jgi:PAS domain S-box-containing protein